MLEWEFACGAWIAKSSIEDGFINGQWVIIVQSDATFSVSAMSPNNTSTRFNFKTLADAKAHCESIEARCGKVAGTLQPLLEVVDIEIDVRWGKGSQLDSTEETFTISGVDCIERRYLGDKDPRRPVHAGAVAIVSVFVDDTIAYRFAGKMQRVILCDNKMTITLPASCSVEAWPQP